MNRLKKVFASLLAVLIVCSSCIAAVYAYEAQKTVDFNVLMLENVLAERKWVIETLVDGNYTNNPFTEVVPYATEQSMMKDVLDNYKEDEAFRYLVDTMDIVDNAGNYIGKPVEELFAVFSHLLGFMDGDELITYVDESIKSVKDLKYESILNDVLQTDYTSSWGTTLFESNSSLEQYRQMSKTLSSLSKYQKALKDNSEVLSKGYFEDADAFTGYVDNFIDAYEDNLYDALTEFVDSDFINNNEALTKHILNTAAMTFVLGAELETPKKRANATDTLLMSELYSFYFASEIESILKGAGKALEIGSTSLKYAQLLDALISQNDSTVQVMQRMRSHAVDYDLSVTLKLYSDLVENQANEQILAYDVIVDYVNSKKTSWIGDKAIKGAGKFFDSLLTLKDGYFDADLQIMTNATSQNLIKLGKCVSIGTWLADKATNIKDTAKEIYICKYTDKILTTAIDTYKADYANYLNNKTDENAKKCIDDLEYIKKLRLYGEDHAYKSICSQTESIVGIILGSSDIQEDIEKRYNANIDSLLGCTIIPQKNVHFVVNKGDTLTLMPIELANGEMTLVGTLKTSDGKTIEFPEAQHLLQCWITVNGGTIELLENKYGNSVMVVPAIRCTDNSTINLYGSQLYIGKLQNAGTLNVNYKTSNAKLTVIDSINNTATINISGNGNTTEAYIVDNSKNINMENSVLNITGSINNSGSISGNVLITSTGTNPYYSNSYIENPIPTVSGTGTITNLAFSSNYKKGISIVGEQCISESLTSGNTRLRTSENLVLTGSCTVDKSTLEGNLTFRDYTSPSSLTVDGMAYIENDVVFNHSVTFNDGLHLTSSCKSLTVNSPTNVKGDMEYKAGKINGSDWLILHGDLNITASSPGISKLDFVGTLPQKVSSSSTLTVSELNNHNTSLNGVTFNSLIYVTGTLQSGSTSAYANGKNVVLTGDAKLNGNTIRGSISAKDWNLSDSMTVNGTLFTSGAITLKDGKTLNVLSFNQSDGELIIEKDSSLNITSDALLVKTTVGEGASININGDTRLSDNVSNNGSVVVKGDCEINGAFTGGTLTVSGDLNATGKLTPSDLIFVSKTAQYFKNTAETTVDTLTLDNSSSTGVTINSLITIKEKYNNNSTRVTGGKNLVVVTSDGSIIQDEITGDITIEGTYTIPENETVIIKGSLYLNSGADLIISDGATLEIRNNLISENSAITVNEDALLQINDYLKASSGSVAVNGDLLVKGDAEFNSVTLTSPGLMTFKGDLIKNSGTWTELNILFDSKTAQKFTTDGTLSINNLTFENTSLSGISVVGKLNVTGSFTNNCKHVDGIDNIVITGDYTGNNSIQGNFVLDGTKIVEEGETIVVNGNLNLSSGANLIISDGAVMKVQRSVISNGAKITVEDGGQLIVADYLSSSSDTFTIDGTMLIKGDVKISSSTVNSAGLITFKGDLNVSSGTWNSPNIAFESKLPQVVNGSAFRAGDLTIDNNCKTGIRFDVNVTYSGSLEKSSSVITGEERLIYQS